MTPTWYAAAATAANLTIVVASLVWLVKYRPAAHRALLVAWLFRFAALVPLHTAVRELWQIPGPGVDPTFRGWWDATGAFATPLIALVFLACMYAARRESEKG